ncbi:MAG: adenylate kinase [Candidatus Altiarchaeales archaeon]|nr:adenylate kinase [Candidatus Altiarchaeales archaeon]MBD3415998.1 adenylate kinase [Candidatus Altiarchaeales archaeon]
MLVVMTGVPGVGKSTVVKTAFKQAEEKGIDVNFDLVNFGDMMLKTAEKEGLVKHRDEMRQLPVEQQHSIQKHAAAEIRKMADSGDVILDTHASIETPNGFIPGMPEWVLREMKPDVIVVLESRPEDVNKFRKKDLGDDFRRREVDNIEGIERHQSVNRSIAMAYSVFTGTPIKLIWKPEGTLPRAAEELLGVLSA